MKIPLIINDDGIELRKKLDAIVSSLTSELYNKPKVYYADFLRRVAEATKPRPANIIAQVSGSGAGVILAE